MQPRCQRPAGHGPTQLSSRLHARPARHSWPHPGRLPTRPPAGRTGKLLTSVRGVLDPDSFTDTAIPLSQLQQRLEAAIDNEDYEAAAQLRDEIERRRFDNRLAVEEANDRFYAAFTSGNLPGMASIWGKGEQVQCIHPGSACIAGREGVLQSWKLVLAAGRMKISLEDVRIFAGESQAFVTCVEVVDAGDSKGRIAATNVFERQGGVWKMVHHHASPVPRIV